MNERSIFMAALDRDTPEQRAAYLDEACGGDAALRQQLEALLQSHDQAGGFLGKPVPERFAEYWATPGKTEPQGQPASAGEERDTPGLLTPSDQPGALGRLGHYQVLEVIGRGGMGVVLRALDEKLHRVVAIKAMAAQIATSATARKRFDREARAAAAVSHDHVVTIHAVDEANGIPYLVMQCIDGVSLEQRLERGGPLRLDEILRIGMQTASGLAAAHAQGLIHRDVKPANILLENGVERVKLTDFGLARAADEASLTQSGVVAGTPQYMSPEQARGEALDHRADLFSLGSVLYAMCTGRAPFRASGSLAVLKRVCEEAPSPVREANPELPHWLVAIIEKLHAKDPADRFQSAAEVAEVLGRHLAHMQHLSAAPPQIAAASVSPARQDVGTERSRRRKRRWAVAAALLLCLLAGLGFTEAAGVTNLGATVIRIFTPEGILVVEVDDPGVTVTIEGDRDLVIAGAGLHEVRLKPGSYRLQATKAGKSVRNEVVTITRGDKQVVKIGVESAAPAARGAFRFTPPAPGVLDRLDPARIPADQRFGWEPKELVAVLGEHRGKGWEAPICVTFSPDGSLAASGGYDGSIYIWNAETLRLRSVLAGHTAPLWYVVFSPDGRRLLSASDDKTVRLWDLGTGREIRRFGDGTRRQGAAAFSPDGRRALAGGDGGVLRMWDVETGRELARFEGHTGRVGSVAFSPDGSHVLSTSHDKTLRLWEARTGKHVRAIAATTADGASIRIVYCPDGAHCLSASQDRTLRLWDVQTGMEVRRFEGHTDHVHSVAVSRDGRQALSGGRDQTVRLWDVATGRELRCIRLPAPVSWAALSPDGRRALSSSWDGSLRLWDLKSGKELHPVEGVGSLNWNYHLSRVALSPDGRRLLCCMETNAARLWDVETGKQLHAFRQANTIWAVGFTADGRRAFCAGGDSFVFYDVESGKELRRLEQCRAVWSATLSRDERYAATGCQDGTVRLWDLHSGRELLSVHHGNEVYSVAFAPDGSRVLSGSKDGTVRFWDMQTGQEMHRLTGHRLAVWSVAVSPTGRHAASSEAEGFVRLWDLTEQPPRMRLMPRWHTHEVRCVAFAPDGKTLASSGYDGRVILWDVAADDKVREWKLPGPVYAVAFAADGRHLATVNGTGTVYILRLGVPESSASR